MYLCYTQLPIVLVWSHIALHDWQVIEIVFSALHTHI